MVSRHFLAPVVREPTQRWRLVHEATGRTLAHTLHAAFDSASRKTGLLGRDQWPAGEALVIAPCQAVHTVGMQFPIDVLFLRRDGTAEKVKVNVSPWRMTGSWRAFAVIEMAAGTLEACGCAVSPGDRLRVARGIDAVGLADR